MDLLAKLPSPSVSSTIKQQQQQQHKPKKMTSVRSRWRSKLSSFRSSSSSSSSSSSASSTTTTKPIDPLPPEFLCPISSSLMYDPVIVATGHSFDRPCIEACLRLSFSPPPLRPASLHSLIPNLTLKTAIDSWCARSDLPLPHPISLDTALDIVRALMAAADSSSSSSIDSPPPKSTSSSSIASDETLIPDPNPLEQEIVNNLKDPQISTREFALVALRHLSRESEEKRTSLCTPNLLSAVIPFLLSRTPELQINAAASLVNLSIDPSHKVRIVRSGAVPNLVEALKSGHPEARDHAAGAVFSLSIEDDNRLAVGALGAVPPLVHLFYQDSVAHRARKEAGMALYYLTLAANNAAKLARTSGAARAIVRVAGTRGSEEAAALRRVAVMVMGNLAGRAEGRVALMDAGAVGTVVEMLKEGSGREVEHCIGVLYKLSRGSLRFRTLAKEAGAEEALKNAAAEHGEMVRYIVRVVRGDEDWGVAAAAALEVEEGSVVSDGMVAFRPRYQDIGSGTGSYSSDL